MKSKLLYIILFSLFALIYCDNTLEEHPINKKLIYSIKKGNIKNVKNLLSKGASPDGYISSFGKIKPALITAVRTANYKIVEILLKNGANPDFKGNADTSPLIETCFADDNLNKHFKILKLLIKFGADVNMQVYGDSALASAVMKGNVKVVKYLVEHGANVNTVDLFGNTILINLCNLKNEQYEIAKYLIKKGADIRIKNHRNLTALDYAKKRKFKRLISLLQKNL